MMTHHSTKLAVLLMACFVSASTAFFASQTRIYDGRQLQMSSQQAEYGQSLELPETYASCGRCQTAYAIKESDLGEGRGRRLECSVCGHSWFQSRDRLMDISEGFEMVALPDMVLNRIKQNVEEGRNPKYMGELKLYVGNIAFASTEEEIYELFSDIGDVGDVALVRDDQGRNRGFGFVTMRTKDGGEKAMEALDGKELNGRNLAVRESNN